LNYESNNLMTKFFVNAFVMAVVACCVSMTGAHASLINGSFEDPNIGNNFYVVVGNGDPTITGWTVGGSSVDIVNKVGAGNSNWANDGDQSIDLAGTPGPGSLTQFAGTTASASYVLSFQVSSNGGPYINGLQVFWNGSLLDTITTPAFGTWETKSYLVTATGASTELTFSTDNASNQGPLLDDVSLTQAVPEPGSIIMLSLGGIGMGLAAWRRRRAVA
jgi:choice-of-anchor C domain-containing protein